MAIQIIREVNADVVKRGSTKAVYAKQNDLNSRFLNVRIQADGNDILIDPSLTVLLNAERPDKAENVFFGTVNDDGTVQVPLTPWMLELEGTVICDISIVSSDPTVAKLTTMQFNIYVEASVVLDENIVDPGESDVVVELIARTVAVEQEAEEALALLNEMLSLGSNNYSILLTDSNEIVAVYASNEYSTVLRRLAGYIGSFNGTTLILGKNVEYDMSSGFVGVFKHVYTFDDTLTTAIKSSRGYELSGAETTVETINSFDYIGPLLKTVFNIKINSTGDGSNSIINAEINDKGELVLTYSDGTSSNLGVVKGKDGKDGTNGTDGKDGISCTHSFDGTILTVTSASGTTSADLKGEKGDKGEQGEKGEAGKNGNIIAVTDVSESSEDDGNNVVTFSNGVTLTVKNGSKGSKGDTGPQGLQGVQGEQGIQGEPGVKGDKGEKGEQGIQGEKGADGKDGVNGTNGKDGYTPVKGKDYFTEEDKTEIVEAVTSKFSNVPEYWSEHINSRIDNIREAMENAGRNKSSFFFYSDAHWNNNSQMSPILLKYLYEHTPINKVNFGGDIVHTEDSNRSIMEYLWNWRKQIRGLNHYSVIGNHDDGNATDRLFSPEYIYSYLFAPEENNSVVHGGDYYYYVDDVPEKTRYLYLDTSTIAKEWPCPHYLSQLEFVCDTLNSVPENWHVVAVAHIWYNNIYDGNNVTIDGFSDIAKYFLKIFSTYNNRGTGKSTDTLDNDIFGGTVQYDFTNAKGKVEFCIGGHAHMDYNSFYEGIPVIITDCDSYGTRTGLSSAVGTIAESSVNAVVANYSTQQISVIRVGRGNSFTVDMTGGETVIHYSVLTNLTNVASSSDIVSIGKNQPYSTTLTATVGEMKSVMVTMDGADITETAYNSDTGVVSIEEVTGNIVITAVAVVEEVTSYTNVLKSALDADGESVYNGIGYKADTRWSESGQVESSSTGTYLTGYILVKANDVIRLANITADSSNFKMMKTTILGKSEGSWNHAGVISDLSGEIDGNGNIIKFAMPGNITDMYLRISCGGINETSVITINEEIE